jgi:hypothetical protein
LRLNREKDEREKAAGTYQELSDSSGSEEEVTETSGMKSIAEEVILTPSKLVKTSEDEVIVTPPGRVAKQVSTQVDVILRSTDQTCNISPSPYQKTFSPSLFSFSLSFPPSDHFG